MDYKAMWENLEGWLHEQEDVCGQDVRHGTICEVLTKMEEQQVKEHIRHQVLEVV